ncbi:MAG: rRNA pseudouridine synthase [Clostridia bacterium]|nr:rRNA pseudouridine synthase [Clostridia bacterium]
MRLDHLLVTLGLGSRKDMQREIRKGAVQVNGDVIRDPGAHVTQESEILVSSRRIDTRLCRHVMLYKPCGVLTAARDKKQKTVMDLLPPVFASIGCMPCGRLDKDTEGLLFLTTDGELSHRLLSPARHVDKCYEARVEGRLGEKEREAFASGLDLGDFVASPSSLTIMFSSDAYSLARVVIHEGKFHQVRRMFDKVSHPVTALKRLRFGPLLLDEALQPGTWRELTQEETEAVYAAVDSKHE